MPRRVVVVGGGIAGLAAAWEGTLRGDDVTVVEASPRWGGLVQSAALPLEDGATPVIDEGADAFLARVPDATDLVHELGLDHLLTQPEAGRAKVWTGSDLRWFPQRSVLGVPLDPDDLRSTGLLSEAGLDAVAAGAEIVEPRDAPDEAVGPFLRSRFGAELVERIVGPLVGGINAGDVEEMSLRAVVPQLADAARAAGDTATSLTDELRRRSSVAPAGPVFHGLVGGTAVLVSALVEQLTARGADLRLGVAATGTDSEMNVITTAGELQADLVVLCTPAAVSASLVEARSAHAAERLRSIPTASVALTTLVWNREDVGATPPENGASGFLVPRSAGLTMTAASFGSTKWPEWDDGEHVVLRVSAGHRRDGRPEQMTDDELVAELRRDLRTTLGIEAPPLAVRASRWPGGFHQYTVGHLDRIDEIEAALRADTDDGVRLAGAAYRGIGIPACIRQGRTAVS